MPSDSPVPALSGGLSDFFTGLSLPLRSLSMMVKSGKLFALSLFASFVTGLTLVALLLGLWPIASRIARAFTTDAGWGSAIGIVFYLLLLVVGALTVPALLLAPLQDPISEATEERCGDFVAPPFSFGRLFKSAGTSIAHTASRLLILVVGFLALLPLNLVPGVGSAAYGLLAALWAMWWLAAEYLSGPMARHLMPFKLVLRGMKARPLVCFGFGLALYVLLWVPVLNFFLVPVAVVGGTLLFRALKPHLP